MALPVATKSSYSEISCCCRTSIEETGQTVMVGLWSSLSKMVISVVEGWVFLFLMLAFPATPSQIACEVYTR